MKNLKFFLTKKLDSKLFKKFSKISEKLKNKKKKQSLISQYREEEFNSQNEIENEKTNFENGDQLYQNISVNDIYKQKIQINEKKRISNIHK